jgi:hypothetical protein
MPSAWYSPYLLLRKIPVFDTLRFVFRWVFFFIVTLAALVAMLARSYLKKPLIAGGVLVVAFGLMLHNRYGIAEVAGSNPVGTRLPEAQVYDYLKVLPQGPVLALPIPGVRPLSSTISAHRMLFQLGDHRRTVMGHSGFVPPITRRIREYLLREGISDSSVRKLASTGVRYLVVDRLDGDTVDLCGRIRKLQSVKVLYDNNDQMIVELPHLEVQRDLSRLYEIWALPPP